MSKKHPKKAKKQLKIPVFGEHFLPIEIFFCANKKQWHALLRDRGIRDEPYHDKGGARVTQFQSDTRPNICILTISGEVETRSSVEVLGMLAHELTHMKQFVEFSMYGNNSGTGEQRLDIETEAYLMQKLTMWAVTAYADSGRKFKDE